MHAVPAAVVKSELDKQYEKYGSALQLDVSTTIYKDLEEESRLNKQQDLMANYSNQKKFEDRRLDSDLQQTNRILHLFIIGEPIVKK